MGGSGDTKRPPVRIRRDGYSRCMSERALRRARVARGLVVSATGAVLGLGAHVLAGGAVASPVLLLLLAVAAAACTLASDRPWSLPRLLVALTAIQLGVHLVMVLQMTDNTPAQAVSAAPNAHGTWVMLAGHAAAAVATAWLLRSGEALFWRVVDRLRPTVLWPTAAAPVPVAATRPAPRPQAARRMRPLAGALARRGPPRPMVA